MVVKAVITRTMKHDTGKTERKRSASQRKERKAACWGNQVQGQELDQKYFSRELTVNVNKPICSFRIPEEKVFQADETGSETANDLSTTRRCCWLKHRPSNMYGGYTPKPGLLTCQRYSYLTAVLITVINYSLSE